MSTDVVSRVNAALDGRYRIEREIGSARSIRHAPPWDRLHRRFDGGQHYRGSHALPALR